LLKTEVNDALRIGLSVENQAQQLPPFKIKPEYLLQLKRRFSDDGEERDV
jgi:hypothetical protein